MRGEVSNRIANVDSGSRPFNIATISHSMAARTHQWQRGPINVCQEHSKRHRSQSIAIVTPNARASPRIYAVNYNTKPPWTEIGSFLLILLIDFYRFLSTSGFSLVKPHIPVD